MWDSFIISYPFFKIQDSRALLSHVPKYNDIFILFTPLENRRGRKINYMGNTKYVTNFSKKNINKNSLKEKRKRRDSNKKKKRQ